MIHFIYHTSLIKHMFTSFQSNQCSLDSDGMAKPAMTVRCGPRTGMGSDRNGSIAVLTSQTASE